MNYAKIYLIGGRGLLLRYKMPTNSTTTQMIRSNSIQIHRLLLLHG